MVSLFNKKLLNVLFNSSKVQAATPQVEQDGKENKSGFKSRFPLTFKMAGKVKRFFAKQVGRVISPFSVKKTPVQTAATSCTAPAPAQEEEQPFEVSDDEVEYYVSNAIAEEDPSATIVGAEAIGEGGQGLVLAVHCERADKTTYTRAVKLMPMPKDPQEQDKLVMNVMMQLTLNRLKHSRPELAGALVATHAYVNRSERFVALVAPFEKAAPLDLVIKQLKRDYQLTFESLESIFFQLTILVTALHKLGVYHRDIKPENILIGEDGRLFLIDFDMAVYYGCELAVAAEQGLPDFPIEEFYVTVGTPGHIAPEVENNLFVPKSERLPYSPACDWYSVGTTLEVIGDLMSPFASSSRPNAVEADKFSRSIVNLQNPDSKIRLCAAQNLPREMEVEKHFINLKLLGKVATRTLKVAAEKKAAAAAKQQQQC